MVTNNCSQPTKYRLRIHIYWSRSCCHHGYHIGCAIYTTSIYFWTHCLLLIFSIRDTLQVNGRRNNPRKTKRTSLVWGYNTSVAHKDSIAICQVIGKVTRFFIDFPWGTIINIAGVLYDYVCFIVGSGQLPSSPQTRHAPDMHLSVDLYDCLSSCMHLSI